MHAPSLIEKKRDGCRLEDAEIAELIAAYSSGGVPDYQMSAFAMAVFFSGMSDGETAALTAAMRDSGRVFRWPEGSPPKVDKHSTGGIGDKVSQHLFDPGRVATDGERGDIPCINPDEKALFFRQGAE